MKILILISIIFLAGPTLAEGTTLVCNNASNGLNLQISGFENKSNEAVVEIDSEDGQKSLHQGIYESAGNMFSYFLRVKLQGSEGEVLVGQTAQSQRLTGFLRLSSTNENLRLSCRFL